MSHSTVLEYIRRSERAGLAWPLPDELTELVYFERYKTRAEAKRGIFEYSEAFYSRLRQHSALGYR